MSRASPRRAGNPPILRQRSAITIVKVSCLVFSVRGAMSEWDQFFPANASTGSWVFSAYSKTVSMTLWRRITDASIDLLV